MTSTGLFAITETNPANPPAIKSQSIFYFIYLLKKFDESVKTTNLTAQLDDCFTSVAEYPLYKPYIPLYFKISLIPWAKFL